MKLTKWQDNKSYEAQQLLSSTGYHFWKVCVRDNKQVVLIHLLYMFFHSCILISLSILYDHIHILTWYILLAHLKSELFKWNTVLSLLSFPNPLPIQMSCCLFSPNICVSCSLINPWRSSKKSTTSKLWTQSYTFTVIHAICSFLLQTALSPSAGPLFWPDCIAAPNPNKFFSLVWLQQSVPERSYHANGMRRREKTVNCMTSL